MRNYYKSPEIKFESFQLKEEIANTCWGGHGNSMTWYYDISGEGYVSFQIGGGSCTLNLSNITYHDKSGNTSPVTVGSAMYNELAKALKDSGGESGNPFKGEGVDFPITPDPGWS